MSLISAFRTIFSDPGYISKDISPPDIDIDLFECVDCNAWKPPRAHHCTVCQKCVIKVFFHTKRKKDGSSLPLGIKLYRSI